MIKKDNTLQTEQEELGELSMVLVEENQTKADVIYEYSDKLSKEEFKDLMFKEYDKVKNDAGYFFANYFKVKWNETKESK
jgi:hypothetical protein